MVYEQEVWHPTISVLPEVMCKGPALARAEEMTRHVIMQNIKKTSQGAPSWMRSALRWLCDVPSDEHLRACCRCPDTELPVPCKQWPLLAVQKPYSIRH